MIQVQVGTASASAKYTTAVSRIILDRVTPSQSAGTLTRTFESEVLVTAGVDSELDDAGEDPRPVNGLRVDATYCSLKNWSRIQSSAFSLAFWSQDTTPGRSRSLSALIAL